MLHSLHHRCTITKLITGVCFYELVTGCLHAKEDFTKYRKKNKITCLLSRCKLFSQQASLWYLVFLQVQSCSSCMCQYDVMSNDVRLSWRVTFSTICSKGKRTSVRLEYSKIITVMSKNIGFVEGSPMQHSVTKFSEANISISNKSCPAFTYTNILCIFSASCMSIFAHMKDAIVQTWLKEEFISLYTAFLLSHPSYSSSSTCGVS